jgi:hypothetical protein
LGEDSPGPKGADGTQRAFARLLANKAIRPNIKFPEMASNYRIRLKNDNGDYVRKVSKTINTTSDTDLLLVSTSYYLVRTIHLPGEGRNRIEVTVDGERMLLNGKDRPAVFSYR